MKSHFVPPAPSARLCGGKEGKGMAAKSETALRGTAARRPASTMSSPWARRAGDVAPYHGCHGACAWVRAWRVHGAWTWCALCMMVGADVPGGPRTRVVPDVVPDVVPVGAARRGRRALPWTPWCGGAGMACAWCGHGAWTWCALCVGAGMVCIVHDGRGRRPRRPAYTMSSPMSSPWARRAGDVAPYHGCHGACAWCGHGVCMMAWAAETAAWRNPKKISAPLDGAASDVVQCAASLNGGRGFGQAAWA